MKKLTVNGELTLTFPDGFREMTREELDTAFADTNRNRAGIRDGERHVILVVQWHRANVLLAALTDPSTALRGTEFRLRRLLKDHEYRRTGTRSRQIAGRNAKSFRYEYRMQGVLQEGEVFLLKKKTMIYTIYTYTRVPAADEARRTIDEVLDSVSL